MSRVQVGRKTPGTTKKRVCAIDWFLDAQRCVSYQLVTVLWEFEERRVPATERYEVWQHVRN